MSSNQEMETLIIDASEFNPSTDMDYNKPKINKAGGKSVPIINKRTRRVLLINTPLMLTWGVNKHVAEDTGKVSYSMSLQFPREDYMTPETSAFLAAFEEFQQKIKNDAITHSKEWFNKAKLTEAQIDVLFNEMLYYPKDKETGERKEGASPTLKLKLDYYDEKFNCEIYDLENKMLFPSQNDDDELTPEDLITKASNVACAIKCGGIYFVNGKFGVTWKLEQAVLKPKLTHKGRCIVKVNKADREKMASQPVDDDEVDDDVAQEFPSRSETNVQVENDSDEEEEPVKAIAKEVKEEITSVAEPVKPAPKKVVKKKVIRKKASE